MAVVLGGRSLVGKTLGPTYACAQVLGDAEEGVGQHTGAPSVEGLAAYVAVKDLLDVEP